MSVILKPTLGSQLNLEHRLSKGLAAFWLFNEGSGNKVFDLSGNGNTGAFQGTGLSWTSGKFGSALNFTGVNEDYIDCGDKSILDLTGDMTVVALVNPDTLASIDIIASKSGASNETTTWELRRNEAGIEFLIGEGSNERNASKANVFVIGTWIHIVGTVTAKVGGVRVFADAVEGTPANAVGTRSTTTENTAIGVRLPSSPQRSWQGQIGYVYLYNRALSASEIEELYLRPFIMFDRIPIELWVGATSVGAPPVGNAGIMTTNTGYWGPTF